MINSTTAPNTKLVWDVPCLHNLGTMDDVRGTLEQPENDTFDQPDFPAS